MECQMILPCRFVIAAGFVAALASGSPAQELTDASYAKWRDYVLPTEKDLAYKAIPWRASFWDAVGEAQAKDRPILLWAMNGHPLGCT
jgi:hypothetical protein